MKGRLALMVVILSPGVGCTYLEQRGNDFLDIWKFELAFGPSLQADVKLGELIHLGLGSSDTGRGGFLYGLPRSTRVLEHHFPWSLVMSLAKPEEQMALHSISYEYEHPPQHRCFILIPYSLNESSIMPSDLHAFDIEAGAYLVMVGVRVGVSLGELLDFVLGIWGFDLAGDDPRHTRAHKHIHDPKPGFEKRFDQSRVP